MQYGFSKHDFSRVLVPCYALFDVGFSQNTWFLMLFKLIIDQPHISFFLLGDEVKPKVLIF